jgi:hypothetical protein
MATESQSVKSRLSLEEVMASDEFKKLNPGQRKFVGHYIRRGLETGTYDEVSAVMFAYSPKAHVNIRAGQCLRNRHIRKVLDLHFRRSPLEAILADLRKAARQSVKLKMGLTPATSKVLQAFARHVHQEPILER